MDEDKILQLIKEHDPDAYTRLVETYKPTVEHLSFQFGVDPNEIASVVQEIFTNVLRSIDRVDEGELSIFIYRKTIAVLKSYQRKRKREEKVVGKSISHKQYGYYFEKEVHRKVQNSIQSLDVKIKIPLILHYFHQKKLEEIASLVSCSTNSVKARLQRGMKDLIHELAGSMDEKALVDLLREMAFIYGKFSEFIDKKIILTNIEPIKNAKWKKALPTTIAVIGFVTFFSVGFQYIGHEKEQLAKEKEETLEQEESQVALAEPGNVKKEIDPEIKIYLKQAEENFAKKMGLVDVSNFPSVTTLESLIKHEAESSDGTGSYSVDKMKSMIDYYLKVPAVERQKLLNVRNQADYALMDTLYTYFMFEGEFQAYLDQLLMHYQIPIENYNDIIRFQDDVEAYHGPEELKQLMQVLNEQGFLLKKMGEYEKVTVHIDYEQLTDVITQAGFNEAYVQYLKLSVKANEVPTRSWKEFDTLLLDAELFIKAYRGQLSKQFFENIVVNDVTNLLYIYLSGGSGPRPLPEEDRQEYYQFLENHPESIYWDIVDNAIKSWEANNWLYTSEIVDYTQFRILFNPNFLDVSYNDIVPIHFWPFLKESITTYTEYKENLDKQILEGLNPLEIISLYTFAFQKKDEELYTILHANEELTNNWSNNDWRTIQGRTGFIATEYFSENQAKVYLIDWDNTINASLGMEKIDGIWKISSIEY